MIKETVKLTKKYKNIEVLWVNTHRALQFYSRKLECKIITVPPSKHRKE